MANKAEYWALKRTGLMGTEKRVQGWEMLSHIISDVSFTFLQHRWVSAQHSASPDRKVHPALNM